MDDNQDIDNQIRRQLANGDSSAIDKIWEQYASDLFGYMISILCSRQDAEDVLQAVFIKIAQHRQSVAKAQSLKAYLFRIGRNEALNSIKRRHRQKALEAEAAWLQVNNTENKEYASKQLVAALASLPEEQRTVIVLKTYRKKTFREIAERLDLSENTTASRYRYGIEKLRILMRRNDDNQ